MQEDIDYLTSVYIPKDLNNKKDIYDFINTVETLRGENGCPWDIEQTHESIKNQLIEECYEVVDAIENDDIDGMIEELGDVLLHIVFHAVIGKEDGYFNMSDIIESINSKMIYRHPHVFGEDNLDSSAKVLDQWDQLKAKEKNFKSLSEEMEKVARSLPALIRAHKIQKKAAKVGFDFENIDEVVEKIKEEINEILEVYKSNNKEKITSEIGDLLFACVNFARFLQIDEEEALNKSINKFIKRFSFVEENYEKIGKKLNEASLQEMNNLWEESKKYD